MTRVWPHKDYPLRPVGKLTLNECKPPLKYKKPQANLSSPKTSLRILNRLPFRRR